MKQIFKRLKAKTPLFFKKLGAVGLGITAVGGVIKTVSSLAVENPEDIK